MKSAAVILVVLALLSPSLVAAEKIMTSEKLIYALLAAEPEIDPTQHVFLAWKGLEFDSMGQFDLVLLVRLGKVYAITDSDKLAEMFKEGKKRSWELRELETGEVILVFEKPKTTIEGLLEGTFGIRVLSKTTLTPA